MGSKGVLRDSPDLTQKPSSAVLGINRQEISSHNHLPMIVGKVRCNTHTKKNQTKINKKGEKGNLFANHYSYNPQIHCRVVIPSANSCKKKQKQRYSRFPDVGREVGASTKCRFQTRAFLTTYKVTDFVLIRTFAFFSLWKPAVCCFNWGIREAALNHFSRWEVTRGVKKKTNPTLKTSN